jgi:hypothetical protein
MKTDYYDKCENWSTWNPTSKFLGNLNPKVSQKIFFFSLELGWFLKAIVRTCLKDSL